MRTRLALAIASTAVGVLLLGPPAGAQGPAQDSAVGDGAGSNYGHFQFSATSSPTGASPSGTASWEQFGAFHFEGTVSCLAVSGNRAVIGIDVDTAASTLSFAGFFLTAVDGGPAGSGLDSFDATPTALTAAGDIVPTDCTFPFTPFAPSQVTSGDIVVHDAPPLPTSNDECKNGGWRAFGVFKNQGDCVSFVATHGKNGPASG
jgi:hypothetical protein